MVTDMIRTAAQKHRRRALHDARTTVALYACTESESETTAATFETLRRYALAREWHVAVELLDHAPLESPLAERPGWARARDAITAREIEGVVALHDQTCTGHNAQLLAWLAEHAAFLATVETSDERTTSGRSLTS